MIAALFVQKNGIYYGLPNVDPWDATRDARFYDGPWPVVAHPPCSRWCRLAGLVEARWGHKRGEDGGCFAHALDCVRKFGGVLEHPAVSTASARHALNAPPYNGGWIKAGIDDPGWVTYVEQYNYGHPAIKGTWLYACHVDLPKLDWRHQRPSGAALMGHDSQISPRWATVSYCGNVTKYAPDRPRLSPKAASATPIAFRDILINMAITAKVK